MCNALCVHTFESFQIALQRLTDRNAVLEARVDGLADRVEELEDVAVMQSSAAAGPSNVAPATGPANVLSAAAGPPNIATTAEPAPANAPPVAAGPSNLATTAGPSNTAADVRPCRYGDHYVGYGCTVCDLV